MVGGPSSAGPSPNTPTASSNYPSYSSNMSAVSPALSGASYGTPGHQQHPASGHGDGPNGVSTPNSMYDASSGGQQQQQHQHQQQHQQQQHQQGGWPQMQVPFGYSPMYSPYNGGGQGGHHPYSPYGMNGQQPGTPTGSAAYHSPGVAGMMGFGPQQQHYFPMSGQGAPNGMSGPGAPNSPTTPGSMGPPSGPHHSHHHHPHTADAAAAAAAAAAAQAVMPSPSYTSAPQYSTQLPLAGRHRVTTTLWEDEGTLCFQVDARGVCVARRHDNNMINGTKLLNVCGMSRGKRDGILKNEKERIVVKVGAMHLKGVWISFARGKQLAEANGIADILYPLFETNIQSFLYHPDNYPRTAAVMAAAQERHAQRQRNPGMGGSPSFSGSSQPPPLLRANTSPASGMQRDGDGASAWGYASAQHDNGHVSAPATAQQSPANLHQHQNATGSPTPLPPVRPPPVDRRHSMPVTMANLHNHPGHAENPYASQGRRTSGLKRSFDDHENVEEENIGSLGGMPASAGNGHGDEDSPRNYKRPKQRPDELGSELVGSAATDGAPGDFSGLNAMGSRPRLVGLTMPPPLRSPSSVQSWTAWSTPTLTSDGTTFSSESDDPAEPAVQLGLPPMHRVGREQHPGIKSSGSYSSSASLSRDTANENVFAYRASPGH